MTSNEINNKVGQYVIDNKDIKAKIKEPDSTIYIDVTEKNTFVYDEKVQGLGGLPVGITGKVVCLLSGGIDSPVAAYLAMKRGCHVSYLSFDSQSETMLLWTLRGTCDFI